MLMSVDVLESVRMIAEPVIIDEGMELVDIEYRREQGGWVLRLFIDKEGGITLGDCSNISSQIGHLIEVDDLISNPYTLEVSSPGLNRPLKKEEDFVKYRGRLVKLKLRDPIEGRRVFKGRLLDSEEGLVRIDMEDDVVSLPFNNIRKANLEYEF